jgi:hypothetical protein
MFTPRYSHIEIVDVFIQKLANLAKQTLVIGQSLGELFPQIPGLHFVVGDLLKLVFLHH